MRWAVAPVAACVLMGPAALAATVTTYTDEASFLAALGPQAQRFNADALASGTPITNQVSGLAFSSANAALAGAIPIQAQSSSGAASRPNLVAGGYSPGSPGIPQSIALIFSPAVTAFGSALSSLTPDSVNASLVATFQDATTRTYALKTSGGKPTFLGLKSDTAITRIEYIATKGSGGQSGFKNFGFDNLAWLPGDGRPPICSAQKAIEAGVLGFNGTSTDQAPGDTGIASVTLQSGSTNVSLTCSSPFPAACGTGSLPAPSVSWRIAPTLPAVNGAGTVVATDTQGQTCTFEVTFTAFGGGETDDFVVCRDTGLLLLVTNGNVATPGQIVCGSTSPGPSEPPFPAGYEPSPETDPFPCKVFTIKSPISGPTGMTLKKDGDFEPRLRLLFSRFDGATFPPFSDITSSVDQIDTIIPDPTRVQGSGTWSQVKVACAVQAEICNGLDDDGDGAVDEGIPQGAQAIDCDHDGYPLCATGATTAIDCQGNTVPLIGGASADCNDNLPGVHAGAEELCNGLDDDCDGATDEGNPAGGAACVVAGVLGACAEGVTSCASGPMECVQTHFPAAETCNGVDDDCDGSVDEGNPPGGAACTIPDAVGPCAAGVFSCASGSMACVPTFTPSAEACNGIDDDCDGATDEGFASLTCGVGVCSRTVPACTGGVPQTCVPGTPGTETCNGLDDDCDGRVDEEYTWSGLLQPVNQDGSSIFQSKSTIPLKFRLTSCSGAAVTTAVATIEVLPYTDAIVGTVDEGTLPNTRADTGTLFRFDAKGGQYMFNLGTKGLLPSAAYILRIRINDGSVHDTIISLK
ncbi:MAG TPA: MopE-related protein [Candidatus Polarisedimenticolia bacterium]|nr:MopE-related protein [Candidatus Polarisedimenticolia bacterium]